MLSSIKRFPINFRSKVLEIFRIYFQGFCDLKYRLLSFRDLNLSAFVKRWRTWKLAGPKSNPVKDRALQSLSSSTSFCILVFTWNLEWRLYRLLTVWCNFVNYLHHSSEAIYLYIYIYIFEFKATKVRNVCRLNEN